MSKSKVKSFVKNHKKEIIIGGGLSLVGYFVGKRAVINHIIKDDFIKECLQLVSNLKGCYVNSVYGVTNEFTIDQLGDLGKKMVESGLDTNTKYTNFMILGRKI